MEWLSNFIKGFGRATNKGEVKDTTTDNIKGYAELDGTTYGVTENPSGFEKAGNIVGSVVNWFKGLGSGIGGDKSDIDEELFGLRYEGQDVGFDMADSYINMLSQYDYLNNKGSLTLEEALRKKQLDDELNKFTSAGQDSKFNHGLWTWAWDSWRNNLANGRLFFNGDNNNQPIDREKILGILRENPNVYKYYSDDIMTPSQIEQAVKTDSVPMISEKQYNKQKENIEKNAYEVVFNNKLDEVAERAIKDKNFKITGTDGELITKSDVMKLFSESLSRSGISSTLESQAWTYDKLDDSITPVIRQMLRDNIESLIELQYYQFTHPEMDSKQAQMQYIKESGNDPFSLDFQNHYKEMNDYEKALVNGIDSLAGTVIPLGHAGYGLFGSTMDAEAKARFMGRFINATNADYSGGFFSDVWDFATAWGNGLMMLFGQGESLLSSILGFAGATGQTIRDSIESGELKFEDYVSYYYGFQTSKSFTTTEEYQVFKRPQDKTSKTVKWITDHYSMVDDIIDIIMPAKWFSVPAKFAKLEDVIKVLGKVDDTIDAAKGGTKISKIKKGVSSGIEETFQKTKDDVVEEGGSIVSDVQKATGEFTESQKLWNRVKTAIKNVVKKATGSEKRAANKQMRALGKSDEVAEIGNKGSLFMQNFGRWLGEEVITSLAYQSMVPYDYTYTDLAFDIMGATWSGWLRSRQFWNALGMVKMGAVTQDKIWGLWYIKEVNKTNSKQAKKILDALTEQDLSDIGVIVKTQMGNLLGGFKEMTEKGFSKKVSKLSSKVREDVNNNIDKFVKASNDSLINKLRLSTNKKWNSMVKSTRKRGGRLVWSFNEPGENASKRAKRRREKKLEEARRKAYSMGGLDGDGYIKTVSTIKQYVTNHIEELLGQSGKYKDVVTFKDGKWVFKDGVTEAKKKELIKKLTVQRLRQAGIGLRSVRGKYQREYKMLAKKDKIFARLYKLGIWNELENPIPSCGINLGLRLATYINNVITNKVFDKAGVMAGLDNHGAMVGIVFRRWLNKVYDIADYETLTKKELASKIIEFGTVFDATVEKQFMTDVKIFNENGVLKNSNDLLINKSFEDAIKLNEDLKYMGSYMFGQIASNKNIPEIRREIKLRTYRRDPTISGRFENEFYGIVKEGKHVDGFSGTKVFSDNFEEKLQMGKKGRIYIKLNKDGKAEAIKNVAGTGEEGHNIFDHRTNPKGEGVIELIYEKKGANIRKKSAQGDVHEGLQVYELRQETVEGRSLHVGYINTYTDPKVGTETADIWGEPRYMNVVLDSDEFKNVDFETANFSQFRDGGVDNTPIITVNDVNKNVDVDDLEIVDSAFDPMQKDLSKETRNLKAWQDVVNFVYRKADSSVKSWEEFTKLLPGRTDKVPYGYYAKVMGLAKDLAVGAPHPEKISEFKRVQFNLLLDMMYTDTITHTQYGLKINLNSHEQFRTGSYEITYRYNKGGKKNFKVYTNRARIPSDAELIVQDQGVVIIQKDPNGVSEVFRYMRRPGSMDVFDLYKAEDVTFSNPVGNFAIGGKKIHGNVQTSSSNKTRILGSMEFQNQILKKGTEAELDYDKMIERATGSAEDVMKYGDVNIVAKVDGDGYEIYNKIHRAIYSQDMPKTMYFSLKSIKGMTPERYFNRILDDFAQDRYGKYFRINRNEPREQIASKIKLANSIIDDVDNYAKKYPESGLTDEMLVEIGTDYRRRIIEGGGSFKLTPEEEEIRKMMFPDKGTNLNVDDYIKLTGYREYGMIPNSVKSKQYQLLSNRRDRILAYRLKTDDLGWMDDDLKETLVKRYFGDGGFFKTDEELLNDILEHPKEYRQILDAFADRYRSLINSKKDLDKLNKLLDKLDAQIKKLEDRLPKEKKTKVMGKGTKEYKQYKWEVLQGVLKSKIDLKYVELNELYDKFRLQTPDNPFTEEDFQRLNQLKFEIQELEEGNILYNKIAEYREQIWKPDTITKEQWDEIVRRSINGEAPGYVPHEMTQAEIDARLAQIKERLPKEVKILNYDPTDGIIREEGLTDAESIRVRGQISSIAENIKNQNVTAAHVRSLHAIVINPKMLQEMDIGHEWFHEAINLVGFDGFGGKVRRAYTQAWDKFQKEIEQNARNLGYEKAFMSGDLKMTKSQYQDFITEEWLAERFAEFVNGKYFIENERYGSFIYQFFVELWERIKNLFSDTEVVDLFEDIYKGIPSNDTLKINFSAVNIDGGDIAYRSISKAGHDDVVMTLANPTAKLPFEYGDILGLDSPAVNQEIDDQLRIINDYFSTRGGAKDALVLLGNDFTGRGNLLGMARANVTLPDGRQIRTSYLDIFEKLVSKAKNLEVDSTLEKIYGGPTSELETWVDEALLKLGGGSNSESLSRSLFNDTYPERATQIYDEYPITATLSKNNAGGIDFKLDVNGVQIYEFGTNANNVDMIRNMISERLAQDEAARKNITRMLDSYLAQRSKLVLGRTSLQDFSQKRGKIQVGGEMLNAEEAIKAMGDALWQSILDNYKIRYHSSFDDFSPIYKILADNVFQIYMYDRLIPHLGRSGLRKNIFDGLFAKKNFETRRLIEFIQAYGQSNPRIGKFIDWKIGHDVNDMPVVQFSFDTKGYKRKIGRHLKSDQEALNLLQDLKADGRLSQTEFESMYDEVSGKFKNTGLQSRSWNVSLLSLSNDEMTKYVTEPYIGKNFKQNFREWYNNTSVDPLQIKFRRGNTRDIPFIDGSGKVGHKIYKFDDVDLRRTNTWISDDKLLEPDDFKPITTTSSLKHMEDVKRVMDINKKYNITLMGASPDTKKKLAKMQKSNRWSLQEMKSSSKVRDDKAKLRDLQKQRDSIAKVHSKAMQKFADFENSPTYKQIERIREVLEGNNDAMKAVKSADVNPNVVSETTAGETKTIKYDKQQEVILDESQKAILKQIEDMQMNPGKYSKGRDVDSITKEKTQDVDLSGAKEQRLFSDSPEVTEDDAIATASSITTSTHICG